MPNRFYFLKTKLIDTFLPKPCNKGGRTAEEQNLVFFQSVHGSLNCLTDQLELMIIFLGRKVTRYRL